MGRTLLILAVLVGSLAVCAVNAEEAIAVSTYVYDDFSSPVIDPARWEGSGGGSRNTLEFVREIRNGNLRLGARTYGDRWGDAGSVWDSNQLDLKNAENITSFGALVVVRKFATRSCANNPWLADPEIQLIGGGWFTIGDPDSSADNVDAVVRIQPGAPGGPLRVRLSVEIVGGSLYGEAVLGTVDVGEPVFLFLRWDRANHRFVGGMQKIGSPRLTGSVPYDLDDSRPAASTYRGLFVTNNTPNCVATPTFGAVEAEFDRVLVNVPWEP